LKEERTQSIFSSYCGILLTGLPNEILQKLLAHSCETTKSTAAAANGSSSTTHAVR